MAGRRLPARQVPRHLPRQEPGEAPGNQQPPQGHPKQVKNQHATAREIPATRAGLTFAAAAAATLAAGYALEQSGDQIAGHTGLTGVLLGSTVLAAATSLPELSTGITSVRLGGTQLARSGISGGNAFLPALFLVATLIAGQPVPPPARDTGIYLTGPGTLLTAIYVFGLIFRPRRSIARTGPDSPSVLGLYGLAIAGLITIAT